MNIIYAIIGFGLLIIVHELCQFMLAKANGIKVEEFARGMGPKILSTQGRETKYSLGLFPIGGYVKMLGEEDDVDDERSFSSKSPLRRISVIIAGATMNLLFAILIFTTVLNKFGYTVPVVDTLSEGSPAQIAGILSGDKFIKANDVKIKTADDLSVEISLAKDTPINLVVDRNGEEIEFSVTPQLIEEDGRERYIIGFTFDRVENPGILESTKQGIRETGSMISQTFKSLKMMISGDLNLKTDVGGPVSIIRMSNEVAKNGIWNLVYFIGYISISLAVFNMLPFPALDGGWTVLLLIELITRKKVPEKIVGAINYVGIMILFGIMILVTVKDILFPIQL